MKFSLLRFIVILGLSAQAVAGADTAVLTIDTTKAGVPISPLLYGIFFEDINRSADGGLYAELSRGLTFSISATLFSVFWSHA